MINCKEARELYLKNKDCATRHWIETCLDKEIRQAAMNHTYLKFDIPSNCSASLVEATLKNEEYKVDFVQGAMIVSWF